MYVFFSHLIRVGNSLLYVMLRLYLFVVNANKHKEKKSLCQFFKMIINVR